MFFYLVCFNMTAETEVLHVFKIQEYFGLSYLLKLQCQTSSNSANNFYSKPPVCF